MSLSYCAMDIESPQIWGLRMEETTPTLESNNSSGKKWGKRKKENQLMLSFSQQLAGVIKTISA